MPNRNAAMSAALAALALTNVLAALAVPAGTGAAQPPAAPTPAVQDAVGSDPDKYRVVLENACVRVLDYRDLPGARTHEHHHPAFVLVALEDFQRTLTLPGGKVLRRAFRPGDVMASDAQTHVGENVGGTPTHVIIVEIKGAPDSEGRC